VSIPVPPDDVGTPESCGIAVSVTCVLCGTGTDGKPDCGNVRGGVDGPDCNAFASSFTPNPSSLSSEEEECVKYVKYDYDVTVSGPPYHALFAGAYRYRTNSYWNTQYGNPRAIHPDKVGQDLTPFETMEAGYVQYTTMHWEGEMVDFCTKGSGVDTTFQFLTQSSEAGLCAISDGYRLVTNDVAAVASPAAEVAPQPMGAEEVPSVAEEEMRIAPEDVEVEETRDEEPTLEQGLELEQGLAVSAVAEETSGAAASWGGGGGASAILVGVAGIVAAGMNW